MPELQSKIYKWVFFLNTVYIRLQRCTNRTHAAGVSHLNSVTRSHSLRDSLLHVSTLLTVSAACSSKPFDFFSNLDHVLDPGVNLFSFFSLLCEKSHCSRFHELSLAKSHCRFRCHVYLPGGPKNCTVKRIRDISAIKEINSVKHTKLYRFIQNQCWVCSPCCWTTHSSRWRHSWRGQWSTATVCPTPRWSHAWAARLQWIVAGLVVISCQ